MLWCVLEGERWWYLNKSVIFLSSKVIREKWFISKLLSFLLWPDLHESRYYLKRSTRVPMDSKHPKDSFGLCPTVLSQLWDEMSWRLQPSMCVLGWGTSMCGRRLSRFRRLDSVQKISVPSADFDDLTWPLRSPVDLLSLNRILLSSSHQTQQARFFSCVKFLVRQGLNVCGLRRGGLLTR